MPCVGKRKSSSMTKLRDYQQRAIKMLYDAFRKGFMNVLWVMPTGAGKTTTAGRFVKDCIKKDKKVLIFMHRTHLCKQFAERLRSQFNLPSGLIMSKEPLKKQSSIQIGMVQTMIRRDLSWIKPDVVIIDECHRSKSKSYETIIKQFPNARLVGLTATPFRADGKPLGDIYETIVHPVKINELIQKGFLTPTKVYAPKEEVDMSEVKVIAGDFHNGEMGEKFNDGAVVRGVVNKYLELAKGKKAVVFNVDIKHCQATHEMFLTKGVKSVQLHSKMKDEETQKALKDFARGNIPVINSVGKLVEGFDVPDIEVVILNVATKSLGRYAQMLGRGLRCFKGKDICIVLDFGGNTMRHGFIEDYDLRPFSLTQKVEGKVKEVKKCKSCGEGIVRLVASEKKYKCSVCDYEKDATIREKKKFGEEKEFMLLERETMTVERLLKMPQKKAKETLPLGQLRLYGLLHGYGAKGNGIGWAMHTAIDNGLVDLEKAELTTNPQSFWKKMNFAFKVAEIESGTVELYQQIKSQTKVKNERPKKNLKCHH